MEKKEKGFKRMIQHDRDYLEELNGQKRQEKNKRNKLMTIKQEVFRALEHYGLKLRRNRSRI